MQKIAVLLGLLLAIGGCQGTHQRLGIMGGKEEAGQGGLNTWFESFVDLVDNAEEWDTIAASLDQGKESGYLDKSVEWEEDQYTAFALCSGNRQS